MLSMIPSHSVLFLCAQWDERFWALGRRLEDADLVLPSSTRVPGPNRNRGASEPQRGGSGKSPGSSESELQRASCAA